jgi:hypothetical protein
MNWVPLAEAARKTGIPEEQLRRRILMGELYAQAADDDRQYLLQAKDVEALCPPVPAAPVPPPAPRAWPTLLVSASLALLLVGGLAAFSVFSLRYACVECAATRKTVKFTDLVTLKERVRPGSATAAVREAFPGPCAHRWMLVEGKCAGFLKVSGRGLERQRNLWALESMGVIEAARKVDPRGAAELIRTSLRGKVAVSAKEWAERGKGFLSSEDFRCWFEDLRARASAIGKAARY